jgi:hypothetical protein
VRLGLFFISTPVRGKYQCGFKFLQEEKMKHFLWAALALPLALAACDLDGGEGGTNNNVGNPADGGTDANGVDWTNYQTSGTYSISVRNNSGVDLVAFMDSLTEAKKLGGVKKSSGVHGFKMNETLFDISKDFSIIFLTAEKYAQSKGNLGSQEQTPFTRIYALYNKAGTNEIPFEISNKLGGNNKFRIQNGTSFDVEFRENSPRGISIGFASKNSVNTILNMNDSDFYIYPIFKKYNPVTDEIISIYPKRSNGTPIGLQMEFHDSAELTINAQSYLQNTTGYSMGAALLVIQNRSGNGISIYKGMETQRTETGIETINNGADRTFTIKMNGDTTTGYDSSYDFAGWKVVEMGTNELPLDISPFFAAGTNEKSNKLESDYRYTITIGGSWFDQTETISSVIKSPNKITTELFN